MSKGRHTTTSTRTFMAPPEEPKKPKKKLATKAPKIKAPRVNVSRQSILVVLVIMLTLGCLFLYSQYRAAQEKVESAKSGQNAQTEDVIKTVSKIAIVPKDETPTIATVTNVEKIKDQEFFVNAKNGDKVLVYAKQKKAILYRPSTNQIVNINTVTSVQGADTAR